MTIHRFGLTAATAFPLIPSSILLARWRSRLRVPMTLPSYDMWESLVRSVHSAIFLRTHEFAMERGALRVGRQTQSLAAKQEAYCVRQRGARRLAFEFSPSI